MNELALAAGSPRRLRQGNEIAALRALHRFGGLTRAELARKLKLNRSSSGHIVAGLLASGLVRETADDPAPRAPARVGRPGIKFELVPGAVFFLGLEIGVEHVATVEIDLKANLVDRHVQAFDGSAIGPEAAIEQAVALAFRSVSAERLARCEGIGVSIPGQMARPGVVRVAPLLRWENVDVLAIVRRALPVAMPVIVENDANAFAIGATYAHGGRSPGVTLFIVLESGVGGGVVIDGMLFRGAHGLAGEIGHLRMPTADGGEGALEESIGLEHVLRAYASRSAAERPSFPAFLESVRRQEPSALAVAKDWARSIAQALVQICRVIDPDRIVLGGSLAPLYSMVADSVDAHIRAIQEPSFPVPTIETDTAGRGSAFGAACMLHQRYLSLEAQPFAAREPESWTADLHQ